MESHLTKKTNPAASSCGSKSDIPHVQSSTQLLFENLTSGFGISGFGRTQVRSIILKEPTRSKRVTKRVLKSLVIFGATGMKGQRRHGNGESSLRRDAHRCVGQFPAGCQGASTCFVDVPPELNNTRILPHSLVLPTLGSTERLSHHRNPRFFYAATDVPLSVQPSGGDDRPIR